jgi:hypothetical protein
VRTEGSDGESTFRRTKAALHDAALGQELKSGRHEWTVTAPNNSSNIFAGVALSTTDCRTYPCATSAWALHFQDGALCSSEVSRARQMRLSPKPSVQELDSRSSCGSTNSALSSAMSNASTSRESSPWPSLGGASASKAQAAKGKVVVDLNWEDMPVRPFGTTVHVVLDMDARTLSFAIDDAEPRCAFTGLPASVRPYICSGDLGDNSLMVVNGSLRPKF